MAGVAKDWLGFMMRKRHFLILVLGLIFLFIAGTVLTFFSGPLFSLIGRNSTSTQPAALQGRALAITARSPIPLPTPTPTPDPTPTPAPLTSKEVAMGAFIPGLPQSPDQLVDAYTQLVGVAPHVVMWYANWPTTFRAGQVDPIIARGAVPMISMNPYVNTQLNDAAIAGGAIDSYLHQYAHDVSVWGKPLYYRLAWEMNGCWMKWSPCVNGNTDQSYIAMWQHTVNIFRQEGATNVRWVWCPNDVVAGAASDFTSLYPGDAYVDYVALDGYNWGTSHPGHKWHSFADEFSRSYALLGSMTNKPVIIGETASSEIGGDKAAWITQAFLQDLPRLFPRIKCVIWFDINKETDWRINSSLPSLQAYQRVVATPFYQGTLP